MTSAQSHSVMTVFYRVVDPVFCRSVPFFCVDTAQNEYNTEVGA